MAETIITHDGKCHTLLGSTTPVSIIRDYCGDEVLRALHRRIEEICSDITDIAAMGCINQSYADSIYECTTILQELFE